MCSWSFVGDAAGAVLEFASEVTVLT